MSQHYVMSDRRTNLYTVFLVGIVAFVVIVIPVAIIGMVHQKSRCERAGGVLVKGQTCVSRSVVIKP